MVRESGAIVNTAEVISQPQGHRADSAALSEQVADRLELFTVRAKARVPGLLT